MRVVVRRVIALAGPVVGACAMSLLPGAVAHASTVGFDRTDERIRFVADAGRPNRIVVRATERSVTIADRGARLRPGPRCRSNSSDKVVCALPGVRYVLVPTGAGDDVVTVRNSGQVEVRVRGGSGADTLTGSAARDLLDGGPGADVLAGGAGDDAIYGRAGADVVRGDDGLDVIFGGDGDDRLDGGEHEDYLMGEAGRDVIDGGDDNDLVMAGAGDDVVRGGTSAVDGGWEYVLHGGPGNDRIFGGVGEDRLIGDSGTDLLDGGEDADQFDARDGERDKLVCDQPESVLVADATDDDLDCLLARVLVPVQAQTLVGQVVDEESAAVSELQAEALVGVGRAAAPALRRPFAWRPEPGPLLQRPTNGYDDQVMHLTLLDASKRLAKPIDRWYLWLWTHDAPVMRLYTAPAATGPYTERSTTAAHPPAGYHPAHWSSGDVAWDPTTRYFYSTPHSIKAGRNLNNEPTIDRDAIQTSFVMRSADGGDWTLLSRRPMVEPGGGDAFDNYEIAYGRFLRDIDGNLVTIRTASGHREYVWYYRGTRRVGDTERYALGVATSRDLVNWTKHSPSAIGVPPGGIIFGVGSAILRHDGTVALTITYGGVVYETVSADPFSFPTLLGEPVFEHAAGLYDSSNVVRDGHTLRMVFGSVGAVPGARGMPRALMASRPAP